MLAKLLLATAILRTCQGISAKKAMESQGKKDSIAHWDAQAKKWCILGMCVESEKTMSKVDELQNRVDQLEQDATEQVTSLSAGSESQELEDQALGPIGEDVKLAAEQNEQQNTRDEDWGAEAAAAAKAQAEEQERAAAKEAAAEDVFSTGGQMEADALGGSTSSQQSEEVNPDMPDPLSSLTYSSGVAESDENPTVPGEPEPSEKDYASKAPSEEDDMPPSMA